MWGCDFKFYITICALLFPFLSYAGEMENDRTMAYRYVATFSTGPAWFIGSQQQTLFITPTIEKTYTQNTSHTALSDNELFLGIQLPFRDIWLNQIGATIGATSYANLSGEIWDGAQAKFNNYVYQYHVQHTYLAIKEKILVDIAWYVIPWLDASIGVAWNGAGGFQNTPVISEAVATPNFSHHTQSTFTYNVGVGVQRSINSHWQIGIGYEWSDWGKYYLGNANEQTNGHGPGENHLFTNALLFNLTYIN